MKTTSSEHNYIGVPQGAVIVEGLLHVSWCIGKTSKLAFVCMAISCSQSKDRFPKCGNRGVFSRDGLINAVLSEGTFLRKCVLSFQYLRSYSISNEFV